MKIEKIQINNFRAFYGENIFHIDGKNCLIYGENGSGKSSFYMALKMFIESSAKDTSKNFNYSVKDIINKYSEEKYVEDDEELDNKILLKNIFSYLDVDMENQEVSKNISFFIRNKGILEKISNKNLSYDEITDIFTHEEQIEIVENYLDNAEPDEDGNYSVPIAIQNELIKTHLTNWNSSIEEDLLNYFIGSEDKEKHFIKVSFNSLDYIVGDSNTNDVDKVTALVKCAKIKPFLNYKKLTRFYNSNKVKVKNNLLPVFKEILKNYNTLSGKTLKETNYNYGALKDILNDDFRKLTNKILKTFHADLEIKEFDGVENSTADKSKLYIKATYNGKEILDFHLFLNEARLSALSMAVYFASILKMYEITGENTLKILVLDDILVGLDMGNRLNLIKVLEEYFNDFQIFMLTYDKAWYETFKNYRNDKNRWVDYELYKHNFQITAPNGEIYNVDKPEIFSSKNYFERAKFYYINKDYSACANYLRKEAERLLKRLLGTGTNSYTITEFKSLAQLLDEASKKTSSGMLKKLDPIIYTLGILKHKDKTNKEVYDKVYDNLSLVKQFKSASQIDLSHTISSLQQFTKTILNPQSHDDLQNPIYQRELSDAIREIENLDEIITQIEGLFEI